MVKKGPLEGARGKGAQGAKMGATRGVPAVKKTPLWESKRGQNPSKNVFENMMVFKSLSGSILGSIFHPKWYPKR